MPRLITMGDLVTRCQRRADKENDGHIGTTEWKALISEVYGDLYSLVAETGLRYFESESTITATGAASYNMPADHLGTVGVQFVVNATTDERRDLTELMVQERSWLLGQTGEARFYAVADDQIVLYPKPSSGSYRLLYVPQATDLTATADGTSVDVVNSYGEAMLVWGVACIAKDKGEVDLQFALMQRDRAAEKLMQWATLRALNQARRRITIDEAADDYREGDYYP